MCECNWQQKLQHNKEPSVRVEVKTNGLQYTRPSHNAFRVLETCIGIGIGIGVYNIHGVKAWTIREREVEKLTTTTTKSQGERKVVTFTMLW